MKEIDLQLFEVVEQNDGEKILSLLDAGADFGAVGKSGAITVACAVRNITDVKLLRKLLGKSDAAKEDIDKLAVYFKI